MNLLDRVKSAFAPAATKAQLTQPVLDDATRIGASAGMRAWNFVEPKKRARILRLYADNNEFVRTAINRRKRQVGMATWRIVRRDDPHAKPDPAVVDAVQKLLDEVNPKKESFRSLLDQVIEDILVLDAGCIEKEKTLGGQLLHLYAVNGASIAPDPDWDGTDPRAIRYRQYDKDGKLAAQLRNDQLIYMMMNPSTHRIVGWSPLETLFRVVRAQLFAEDYDYEMIQQNAPNVAIYLGAGITNQQREQYAEYWDAEIAGQNAIAFMNNANPDSKDGPKVLKLRDDTFGDRMGYKKWLATLTAACFEMDLTVFNLTADIQKSLGNTLTARTDEGANGLASGVAEYLTREVVWEIDPLRRHKFEFDDLNQRDEMAQTKIDDFNVRNGTATINEVRQTRGLPPVEWGEQPHDFGPTPQQPAGEGDTPNDSSRNPDESSEREGAKSAVPFAAARQTRTPDLSYLGN